MKLRCPALFQTLSAHRSAPPHVCNGHDEDSTAPGELSFLYPGHPMGVPWWKATWCKGASCSSFSTSQGTWEFPQGSPCAAAQEGLKGRRGLSVLEMLLFQKDGSEGTARGLRELTPGVGWGEAVTGRWEAWANALPVPRRLILYPEPQLSLLQCKKREGRGEESRTRSGPGRPSVRRSPPSHKPAAHHLRVRHGYFPLSLARLEAPPSPADGRPAAGVGTPPGASRRRRGTGLACHSGQDKARAGRRAQARPGGLERSLRHPRPGSAGRVAEPSNRDAAPAQCRPPRPPELHAPARRPGSHGNHRAAPAGCWSSASEGPGCGGAHLRADQHGAQPRSLPPAPRPPAPSSRVPVCPLFIRLPMCGLDACSLSVPICKMTQQSFLCSGLARTSPAQAQT